VQTVKDAVMKHKANFRQFLFILTLVSTLFIFERIRLQNQQAFNKTNKKVREGGNFNISNTDFIFFESLSKYLFITLEK
jgi:hypothetical protein